MRWSQGWQALQQPLGAVLQQLEAVVAGDVAEDGQGVPELCRRLRVAQRPAALVAVPPQVPAQNLRSSLTCCWRSFHGWRSFRSSHMPAASRLRAINLPGLSTHSSHSGWLAGSMSCARQSQWHTEGWQVTVMTTALTDLAGEDTAASHWDPNPATLSLPTVRSAEIAVTPHLTGVRLNCYWCWCQQMNFMLRDVSCGE